MFFFSVTGACSFPLVWGLMAGLRFRAEKRSAQAPAHPSSQAQGGLFCVLTASVDCVQQFVCLSLREF